MKGKLISFYKKSALSNVFVFVVSGNKEELAEYKKIQGANYRENEAKEPLFFSNSPNGVTVGGSINLMKSYDGVRIIVDNTEQEIRKENMIEQQMIGLEAQDRFNRMKYAGMSVDYGTGEVLEVNEPVAGVEA